MPVDRICDVMMDRRRAKRLMDLVHGLYLSGTLTKAWEIEFARNISSWPARGPTVEQAAKLLEISQERRKRTDGITMSVSEGIQSLESCDLEDWEKKDLADLVDNWPGYLQLRDYNRLSIMLQSHNIDFPPVIEVNYRLGRDELASIARQLRVRRQDARKARKAARAPQPPRKLPGAQKGCDNDMTQLHSAISRLQGTMELKDLRHA